MAEFRYTFGLKYRDDPHPMVSWASPDGWLTVIADTRDQADRLAYAVVGRDYAFGYGPAEWAGPTRTGRPWTDLYLKGELARITLEVKEQQ